MLFSYKNKIASWNWFDEEVLSSTNDAVKEIPIEMYPAVITALKQTNGRGRRANKWLGVLGNLYMTFTLRIPFSDLSRYVCLIGLSLAKTIKALNPSAFVQIKWPNDIFLAHKKVTGMLIENIKDDIWAVGIGVNIVGAPKLEGQAYEATSLHEHHIIITREAFLEKFLLHLEDDIKAYQRLGFSHIREQWLSLAMGLNQKISIKNEAYTKEGVFLTLDENGYLILKTDKGEEQIIAGDLFI